MKKSNQKISLALAALVPFMVQAQKVNYKIEGSIGKVDIGKVYLSYIANGKRAVDSSIIQNGKFTFSGEVPEPTAANLVYSDGQKKKGSQDSKSIFLENGTIKVTGVTDLKTSAVLGGFNNKENIVLQSKLKPSKDKIQELYKSYSSLSDEDKKDTSKVGPIERGIDAQDEIQKKEYRSFVKTHKSSFVALDAVKSYAGYTIDFDDVNPIFSSLSPTIKNSVSGKAFDEKLKAVEKISIGKIAPEFTQNDTSGHPFQLTSLRGKYVLIDFWASWCGPCRAENPNVVKAYNEYKDKNFTILGVSLDQPNGKEKWINAIQSDNLTWNQVSDLKFWNNEVAKLYAVQSIPQNFLLDPSGKIIAKDLRGEALEKKLASLLNK